MKILPTFQEFMLRNLPVKSQPLMPKETASLLTPPVVVALAGRRPDAPNADSKRFPQSNTPLVRQRLYNLFVSEGFTVLVSSAACGADLLALSIAIELGMQTIVVLPFAPALFRRLSVTDRPGDWGELFDRVLEQTTKDGTLRVLNYAEDDPKAFLETNKLIVALAREQAGPDESPVCTLVWDGHPRGEMTQANNLDISAAKLASGW